MKTLATLFRHGITYLVGLLVAWMTLHLTAPDDLKAATDAAHALIEPLVVLAGFVAVILTRLALPVLNKFFRRGAGEGSDGGSGWMPPLAIGWIGFAAVASLGALPSCSAVPVPVGITQALTHFNDRERGHGARTFSPAADLPAQF